MGTEDDGGLPGLAGLRSQSAHKHTIKFNPKKRAVFKAAGMRAKSKELGIIGPLAPVLGRLAGIIAHFRLHIRRVIAGINN